MNKFWIGMFAILLVISGVLVTAKIVQYLSNRATVNIDVESPIEITVLDGTFDVFGGETFVIDMEVKNHANTQLTGNMTTIITNQAGVECTDFDSIVVSKSINDVDNSTYTPVCNIIDDENVELLIYPKPYTWNASQDDNLAINMRMSLGAVGTYDLATQVLI
jgi:hypothetical protein